MSDDDDDDGAALLAEAAAILRRSGAIGAGKVAQRLDKFAAKQAVLVVRLRKAEYERDYARRELKDLRTLRKQAFGSPRRR